MKNDFYINYKKEINFFINNAIKEDLNSIDHSSKASLSKNDKGIAVLIVKENCVIAGLELAEIIYKKYDSKINFRYLVNDGDKVNAGTKGFIVEGNSLSILAMERLVLNCIQRMSGIASLTSRYKKIISKTSCKLLDTRKTTPNFRYPEKWAVLIGGGNNHRMGLYDALMIKDNHIDFGGGVNLVLEKTKRYLSGLGKEYDLIVETRNLKEVKDVLNYNIVTRILLDNMDINEIKKALSLIGNKKPTEASGNIDKSNILAIAKTGVNFISLGCLTHSAKPIDISLKVSK
ncbi:MAG: nicotinate-nucleotide diphosphorylase (carboxylating) [Flavobacteriaceae bacterium]|mgnify:CR=1 FL=1|nr:nicotinate-nucleotide diphosphorylase (carboxylating) [Flavobacteriaceae bacterium]|tara:strand:+ start:45216 stop:46082 length:867 start_codon:yes stop_codon:yes gene_type:complete